VILVDGRLTCYVEKGDKGLQTFVPFDGMRESDAFEQLLDRRLNGRLKRLIVQHVPDQLIAPLKQRGFVVTPRELAKYA
jgi:hypothetical protein